MNSAKTPQLKERPPQHKRKINLIKEIYLTIKTKKFAPTMTLLEYFCFRIVKKFDLPK
jgi:hypothetical protein